MDIYLDTCLWSALFEQSVGERFRSEQWGNSDRAQWESQALEAGAKR